MNADEQVLGTQLESSDTSEAPEIHERFTVASVNLLPARYAQAMALRRAKLSAAVAVVLGVLVVVLAWTVTVQQRSSAQEDLDVATAETTQLYTQAQRYADVPVVFAQVADAKIQFRDAMGSEVRWSFFMNDLALTSPKGVSLDSLDVSVAAPGASGQAGPATGAPTSTIGTMSVGAKALTFNTVANWLDAMAKLHSLAAPQVASITSADESGVSVVSFSATAQITPEARSGRYLEEGRP